jgi:hypothetical protein
MKKSTEIKALILGRRPAAAAFGSVTSRIFGDAARRHSRA